MVALVLLLRTAVAGDAISLEVQRLSWAWWERTTTADPGRTTSWRLDADARSDELRGWLEQLDALAVTAEPDLTTVELLRERMQVDLALQTCRFERWVPVTTLDLGVDHHSLDNTAERARAVAAYRDLPGRLAELEASLRLGLAEGRVAGRETIERRIAEVDAQLASERLAPLGPVLPDPVVWDHREVLRFRADLIGAWQTANRPALEAWRAFLADELLPASRPGSGIASLDDGACYAALIRWGTTESLDADAVERRGERALAEAQARLLAWGAPHGMGSIAAIREGTASRSEAPEPALTRAAELAALAAPATPWFDEGVVGPVAVAEGAECVGSYWRDVMYLRLEHLPPSELAVVVFHEGIPGHHLQLEVAQTRRDLPPFRRTLYLPFFSEGWAFHAEDLAGEQGLYTTDLDRLGWAAFDAWRAARLVVDVGLHERGWSEQRAVDFLVANTLLSASSARCDVTRAVQRPGQGLGYLYGRDAIRALRAEARATLGDRYDDAAFHRVVLEDGAVTKAILERRVRAWLAE